MNISVILVIYNEKVINLPVYGLIERFPQWDFIFPDNSTKNDILAFNKETLSRFNNATFLPSQGNIGLSKAYNAAAKKAKQDWLLFLDQDTEITFEFFNLLQKENETSNAGIHILAPIVLYEKGIMSPRIFKNYKFRSYHIGKALKNGEYLLPINSCTAIRKVSYIKVNGFDERFFLNFVDYSFYLKCEKNDCHIKILDYSIKQHFSGVDFSSTPQSANARYNLLIVDSYPFFSQSFVGRKRYWWMVFKRAAHLALKYKNSVFLHTFFNVFFHKRKFLVAGERI